MLCKRISSKSGILYLKLVEGNFAEDASYLLRLFHTGKIVVKITTWRLYFSNFLNGCTQSFQ